MTDFSTLQPDSADVQERIMSKVLSYDLDVPYEILMDPYRTPARFLPFLAFHYGADLWIPSWTEAQQREAVAQFAGRSTTYPGEKLAGLKTTREGVRRYLALVGAELIDTMSYPQRVVVGRTVKRRMPIGHPPFLNRHLVRIRIKKPKNAFVLGRSFLGRSPLKTASREPIKNCLKALRAAKNGATQGRVDFGHQRIITIDDNIDIDDGIRLGQFVDRKRL